MTFDVYAGEDLIASFDTERDARAWAVKWVAGNAEPATIVSSDDPSDALYEIEPEWDE